MHPQYLTKAQAKAVLAGWSYTDPLPGKGRRVVIAFPIGTVPASAQVAAVAWSDKKNDRGERLYALTFSSGEVAQ